MATVKWHPDDTITELELVRQAKVGAVSDMTIEQTPAGYQVIVRLKWRLEKIALRTRRSETEPRLFKSLERLVDFIRNRFPAVRELGIVLLPPAQPKKRMRTSATRTQ